MQAQRSTLLDVARMAGVSKATASRVLSGSRDRVSDRLAEKVLEAASRLDYRPNPHAQALATAASPMAAVIVHDVGDPYFAEIARGALREASVRERLVVICDTFRDRDRELAYVRELRSQRMQAVVVAGSSIAGLDGDLGTELAGFRAEGGRVVLMVGGHGFPAVVPDNHLGGRLAAEHLVGLGHERVGVISGPGEVTSADDRVAGFAGVLDEAGLPEPVVVAGDFSRASGEAAVETILGIDPSVTAVFSVNDLMAVGAIRRLLVRGIGVPRDISVVGFGDIPLSQDLHPALTTVRVPMADMGAVAITLALEGVDGDDCRVLPTELVARESTGQVKTADTGGSPDIDPV